jgi:hypothetical protein
VTAVSEILTTRTQPPLIMGSNLKLQKYCSQHCHDFHNKVHKIPLDWFTGERSGAIPSTLHKKYIFPYKKRGKIKTGVNKYN